MRLRFFYLFISLSILFNACQEKKEQITTPWGTTLGEDSASNSPTHTMDDIVRNGELIMLTMSGPESYYDYRGKGMGTQYLLCERFAKQLGVAIRVEVCKDTTEMIEKLKNGDADLIAYMLPQNNKNLIYCGVEDNKNNTRWAVNSANKSLADALDEWYNPKLLAEVKKEEQYIFSSQSVKRHVYAPILNRSGGVISHYDKYFQMYAPLARWDWRLMAAQCYQESAFDPQARSWAGAAGLMQIMPGTAKHIGLPLAQIHEPEPNIAAAARYIRELNGHFTDIADHNERINFVLASYNGGQRHIRDAMALARKHGMNPHRWADVSHFVLRLSSPQYYNDPIVKYGYMRGSETVDYVTRIRNRWQQYGGVASGGITTSFGNIMPQRATKKHRYKIESKKTEDGV